jgi:16S rRNA (guanine1207-N2)-methyltransferase
VGYFELQALPGGGYTKPGVRGYPGLEPAQDLLLRTIEVPGSAKRALDLSARGGAVAASLASQGLDVAAVEASAAALAALRSAAADSGFAVAEGELPRGAFDLVTLILPADRGNAAVREAVAVATGCLAPGGVLYLAGEKDRGFERYLKETIALVGPGEIVERESGLRVARIERAGSSEVPAPQPEQTFSIEARGRVIECVTLPGVFAGARLDTATRLLLERLPSPVGKRVLDLGCGCGVIGALLSAEGAVVTMVDDDLPSVAAARETLRRNNLAGRVLHSDVDGALVSAERFDLVVSNPPFHVGSNLILDVAREFVAAVARRLDPGGEAWLVANHFLPYERPLAAVGPVREEARRAGFKVLTARRGSR